MVDDEDAAPPELTSASDGPERPALGAAIPRRTFIGMALALPPASLLHARATSADVPPDETSVDLTLDVNGEAHRVSVDARTTLLDCLRETLGLTGAKKG